MTSDSPRVYLLDVEGTTSPVSLVSEQLFPYARKHLAGYLREHWNEPETRADVALLVQENRAETDPLCPGIGLNLKMLEGSLNRTELTEGHPAGAKARIDVPGLMPGMNPRPTSEADAAYASLSVADEAVDYLLWLMDRDRKSTALKSLQGRIWKSGYEAGELVGTVFPDVAGAFARWSKMAKVAIYSSGSVEAQKLIFRHSSAGDLTPFISAYFDTRTGAKTSADSYRAIAAAMSVETCELLFVSDLLRELDPAREAGCITRLSVREGNAQVPDLHGHLAIQSFDAIV